MKETLNPARQEGGGTAILYCHCAFAQVIAPSVKLAVLEGLAKAGVHFEAVPDLCDMSARKDPCLSRLRGGDRQLRIAACYPRAVQWLFHAAGVPLEADRSEVLNMRELSAEEVLELLLRPALIPLEAAHE